MMGDFSTSELSRGHVDAMSATTFTPKPRSPETMRILAEHAKQEAAFLAQAPAMIARVEARGRAEGRLKRPAHVR